MSGSDDLVVVKVGGSLFDLPDLGARLRGWLERLSAVRGLLVPGGGPTADVVRAFDCSHGLGEETAHWLAVRSLTLNAHFLQALVPGAAVVPRPHDRPPVRPALAVLDPHPFLQEDEGRPGC